MSFISKLIVVLLMAFVFTYVLQNPGATEITFLLWETKIPNLVTTLLVLVIGITIGLMLKRKERSIFK
jgi:uncharacterized integral membrane protein